MRQQHRARRDPATAAPPQAPDREGQTGRDLGHGEGGGPGTAGPGQPGAEAAALDGVEFRAEGVTPARPLDQPDVRLDAGGRLKAVGVFAGHETDGQGHARAREDGDQATHACPCVGRRVGACQLVEGLHVQDRIETEPAGEGAHRLVLAGRGAVGEPDVADGTAEAGGEGVSGAVGVPPEGKDGPGCADGEGGGPAGEDAVDGFAAVRQGLPSGTSTLHSPPADASSMSSRSSRAAGATDSGSARQSSRAPGVGRAWRAVLDFSVDMTTR